MAGSESRIVNYAFSRHSHWQGRSGRAYDLVSENLDHFAMGDADLYLIAKGSHVLWVGSTGELVADPISRSRFRLALDCADRVFRLLTPGARGRAHEHDLGSRRGRASLAGAQAAA